MSEPALAAAPRPYRDGILSGLGCSLLAGLIVAGIDVARTAGGGAGLGFAPALLALWAVPSLGLGLVVGLISAAVKATWGDGAVGAARARLRRDREADRTATAVALAAAVMALPLLVEVAIGAQVLVAGVERKEVGALLLGVVVVASLPVLAALALPVFRLTRRVTALVPPLGPAPGLAVVVIGAVAGVVALCLFFVFTRLDWQKLNLGAYGLLAALPLVAGVVGWLLYGPLDGVRRRIPARGALVVGGALAAGALPLLALRGPPSEPVASAVLERSIAGATLVGVGRAVIDRDGDGYSPFFGGPDCDDARRDVHAGAVDVPGNGVDENCLGGDSKASAQAAPAAPAAPTAEAKKLGFDGNVLILMVDTLRADRLGAAGYRRDGKSLTPRLDALAAQSVYFTRVYAQAPNTPRSMPSIMTSRYPTQVAVDDSFKNYPRLDDKNEMLFEALRAGGLDTLGVASHFYFRAERNFTQGFARFDNEGALDIAPSNKDSASPRIVPRAIDALGAYAKSGQRFAMLVHLFEPHSTYMEHDGFPITEHGTAALAQKYDYEIAFVDEWIGKLLDALDASGLAAKTAVVVISDHGEAFGVHTFAGQRMFFHGQTLYDELLRVPLLVRVPGVSPRKVDSVVQLIDVAPTVADLVGVARPGSWVGRSLVPALAGEPLAPAPAYAELLRAPSWDHEAKAMISGDGAWKLFYRMSDSRFELYDLAADPEEKKNLWDERPADGKRMQAALLEWIEGSLPR